MKNLYFGFLHVAVAMTSILFVTSVTGLNLPLTFLVVGIGTLLFHLLTKNKLAVIMGVSGSYIAGMTYVAKEMGPAYVAGGVVVSGAIYLLMGTVLARYPKMLKLFPKYILNVAVFLIALNLLPIGASLIKGQPLVAGVTLLVVFIVHMSKLSGYSMPIGLAAGTIVQALTGGLHATEMVTKIAFIKPAFSMMSVTMIGVIAIAVCFEALGDSTNCANAQGIVLDEEDMGNVLSGNGVASLLSGLLGGPPLTSYSENVGFIYMSGWKNPVAQLWSAGLFIAMAFIPAIPLAFSYIPFAVFGAMLVFLFALIGANSIKNIQAPDHEIPIILLMLLVFFVTPVFIPTFSPIAAAIIVGMIGNLVYNKEAR